ncbi:MAG: TolC family protein [Planctomycetes bacterium]|nr:TolC family protein [Planctomycetota bacterium]
MRGITPIAGKRGSLLLPALLALGLACPALAADPPPASTAEEMLTLTRLLDLAAASHPDLGVARARVEAARGRMIQAGLRLNPVISIGDEEINNPFGRAGKMYVNFSQEIITAHKRELARAAAEQGVVAVDWQAVTRWYDVAVRVRSAYYEALTAWREVQTNEAAVRLAVQGLQAAEKPEKAGAGTRPDVLRAEVQRDQARARLDVSRRRFEAAGRLLAAAVGVPHLPGGPLEGTLNAAVPDYDWPVLLGTVLTRSSEVQEAQALVVEAEHNLHLAIAQRTPNVTVQVRPLYSYPDQTFEPMIQVGAPIPIYNRNQGNILAARADVARTEEQVRLVELRLTERLAGAYQRYQAAREQREAYEKRILPRARESLRLVTIGYERGDPKYDFTALLQAQTTLVQSQLAYVQLLGDVWRAVAEIKGLIQDEPPPAGTSCPACPP